MEETYCKRCYNKAICGGQTELCSPCWWEIAAWPVCRITLTQKQKDRLTREKEFYGIRDIRDR